MLTLAHRGYHARVPENTLEAFAAAVELGVDGIETDLRLSADGQLVLLHDRLTPDEVPVGSLTRAELSAALGHEVPTAEEALDAFPDLLWNLEIKEPAAMPGSIELIRQYTATHRLLVSSFWHDVVQAVGSALASKHKVDLALLVAHRSTDSRKSAWQFDGPLHGIVWYFGAVDEAALRQAADSGLANYVYGVCTPEEHRQCARWPLAGVITDWPQRVVGRAGK